VYRSVQESTPGSTDTINNFTIGQDKIDFSGIPGLNSNSQGVTVNVLASAPASIAAHTIDIVTSGGNTQIYANATGASESIAGKHADMEIHLVGVSLTATDLLLHH
jgi:hypothetical protein